MVVTIDGPAGVGKSSVSSHLAKELDMLLLKSGFFYRALSLDLKDHLSNLPIGHLESVFKEQGREWQALWQAIQAVQIYQDGEQILLNRKDVTALLQTPEMDILTPQVSKLPIVRHFINDLLRGQAANRSLIAEGRDMGTLVFPQATHKFFLDASVEVRARRRYGHLGKQSPDIRELEWQIQARDEIDQNKKEGTLKPAEDATIIDTSSLTFTVVCQIIMDSLNEKESSNVQWI